MSTLRAKHKKIYIPDDGKTAPFLNCKLNRKEYGHTLGYIVQNYKEGFVLALDGEWGTGKTTFVLMWKQLLQNKGFKSLYFNAWENDFNTDVLVALISEIEELKDRKGKQAFKNVIEKAAPLKSKIIPAIFKKLLSKVTDDDFVIEIGQIITEVSSKGLEEELKDYATRKNSLVDFRESLKKYVEKISPDKPVVFIIDELDRCRPNYAVEVLEQIKHLFSVEGIVFVLSIDKSQLSNSIKGYYGSESINANEYLRRFIDIEFSLPAPEGEGLCKYFFEYFDFEPFFNSHIRLKSQETKNDKKEFILFSTLLLSKRNLSVRQVEKIFSLARVSLISFKENGYVLPDVFLFLIYLKNHKKEFYSRIKRKELSIQQLNDEIESLFVFDTSDENYDYMLMVLARILILYTNLLNFRRYEGKIKLLNDENDKLEFNSKWNEIFENRLLISITHFKRSSSSAPNLSIDFILKKIDLLDKIESSYISNEKEDL